MDDDESKRRCRDLVENWQQHIEASRARKAQAEQRRRECTAPTGDRLAEALARLERDKAAKRQRQAEEKARQTAYWHEQKQNSRRKQKQDEQ